jgi:hypothetical protein
MVYAYDTSDSAANESLCLSFNGRCHRVASEHGALSLLRNRALLHRRFNITVGYPQTFPPRTMPIYLAFNAGGVMPENGSEIQEVQIVRLTFYMREETDLYLNLSRKLEFAFGNYIVNEYRPETRGLKISYQHSRTTSDALAVGD